MSDKIHKHLGIAALDISNAYCSASFSCATKEDPASPLHPITYLLSVSANGTNSRFNILLSQSETLSLLRRAHTLIVKKADQIPNDLLEKPISSRSGNKSLNLQLSRTSSGFKLFFNPGTNSASSFLDINRGEMKLIYAKAYEVLRLSFSGLTPDEFRSIIDL